MSDLAELKQLLVDSQLGYAIPVVVGQFCFESIDELLADDGYCLELINQYMLIESWADLADLAQEAININDELDVMEETSSEVSDECSNEDDSDEAEEQLKRCGNSKHSLWCVGVPRTRPLSCYSKNKIRLDGLTRECKDCVKCRSRQRHEQKLKKRGRAVRPPQVPHCSLCGGSGHQSNNCKSPRTIPEGKNRCTHPEHDNWSPEIDRVQSASCFYKGKTQCKSCDSEYGRQYRAKKKTRNMKRSSK